MNDFFQFVLKLYDVLHETEDEDYKNFKQIIDSNLHFKNFSYAKFNAIFLVVKIAGKYATDEYFDNKEIIFIDKIDKNLLFTFLEELYDGIDNKNEVLEQFKNLEDDKALEMLFFIMVCKFYTTVIDMFKDINLKKEYTKNDS